jgi:hypothetical protein
MKLGRPAIWMVAACFAGVALGFGAPAMSRGHLAFARGAAVCAEPDVTARRDSANPLALPTKPSSGDPLQGTHFFVDGPRNGQAASTIVKLLGLNLQQFYDSDSWAQFKADHLRAINSNPTTHQLSKIADQEETQSTSQYSEGGGPGAITAQTSKIMCDHMRADRARITVPVISTFFIFPHGQLCPTLDQIQRWQPTFKRYVNEMATAIGRKRAVILEEIDSIGISGCLHAQSLDLWLSDLAYESNRLSKLPHAVTYAEAGASDTGDPLVIAERLWKAGVSQVQGFWTNGTHFAWSSDEIRWAQDVSDNLYSLSHRRYRAHFVVNTAQNGEGPKLNPHPGQQGAEDTCNPPGRGTGRQPTGNVNPTFDARTFRYLDAFLWTGVPGRSNNSNCPNGPWKPGGVFDPRFALELAENANQKLGPGYPTQPY